MVENHVSKTTLKLRYIKMLVAKMVVEQNMLNYNLKRFQVCGQENLIQKIKKRQ